MLSALAINLSAQMHHFHVDFSLKAGFAELKLDSTYADGSSRNFSVDMANFYMSNLQLIKADSSTISYPQYLLVQNTDNSDTNETMLGMIADGSYIGFQFDLGIDSATNHMDPTTYGAGDPLGLQLPSMFWSWSSGYIFTRIEGMFDSTVAGTNSPSKVFQFHIGTDNLLSTVKLYFDNAVTLAPNDGMLMLDIQLDMLQVLNNVDLLTENITHTMNNMPLAMKVTNNMLSAFSVSAMKMGGTTGIGELSTLGGTLFPNPATNSATLQFNNAGDVFKLQVLDMAGRVVQATDHVTGNRVDINTSVLESGLYLVKLTGQSGAYSTRLMVQ